jgi:hypothetical protein
LEVVPGAAATADAATAVPGEPKPIRIVPILLRTFWAAVARFFRRLFGQSTE